MALQTLTVSAAIEVIENTALTITGVKTFATTPLMDAIAEKTAATGVTVDGCLIKDGIAANATLVNSIASNSTDLKPFGTWSDCSAAAAHDNELAATDGFVCAICPANYNINIKTDASNPPTTSRAWISGYSTTSPSIMSPVKKGDRWLVLASGGSPTVYWLPCGA